MIKTELCIIGSGPVALFAAYEAGQFNMQCHLIPACQSESVQDQSQVNLTLSAILMDKVKVFNPGFSRGEWVEVITQDENDHYILTTNLKNKIHCHSLLIAGDG